MAAWSQAGAHTFAGGFSSALEPGNPFSVLSFPEELTRHSFLEREGGEKGTGERRSKSIGYIVDGEPRPSVPSSLLGLP